MQTSARTTIWFFFNWLFFSYVSVCVLVLVCVCVCLSDSLKVDISFVNETFPLRVNYVDHIMRGAARVLCRSYHARCYFINSGYFLKTVDLKPLYYKNMSKCP